MNTDISETIESLKANFHGELVLPDSANYDASRAVWNAMIDKSPAIIARCTGAADVIAALAFGKQSGLTIAIRGAGHNIAGKGTCHDGLVIDLGPMNNVRVDPASQRVFVGPGATLGDLDHETSAFGLAVPTGINSTTGISGLTLGGGIGWLTRKHGTTVDNLVSAEVVMADGKLLRASAEENPDLFWALRGGGGNFGIVTQFEFQAHPLEPLVLTGLIAFSQSETANILRKYRELVNTLPDELSVWTVLRKAPPLPFLPEEVHGTDIVVMPFCYAGDPKEGAKYVDSIRAFGTVLGEFVGEQPFKNWQQAFDPLLTEGARNYWKSHDFAEIKDGAIDAVANYASKLPSGESEIFIASVGGAASRVKPGAMAYANRDAKFVLNVHTRWTDPSEDKTCVEWARSFFEATAPFATGGVYVNFLSEGEGDRIANAYGTNYARLSQIKSQYDPDNVFSTNQNIKPSS